MTHSNQAPVLSSDHLAIISTACRHIYRKHNGYRVANQTPIKSNIEFYGKVNDYLNREYDKPMLDNDSAKVAVFEM